jgi:hypothetical protein
MSSNLLKVISAALVCWNCASQTFSNTGELTCVGRAWSGADPRAPDRTNSTIEQLSFDIATHADDYQPGDVTIKLASDICFGFKPGAMKFDASFWKEDKAFGTFSLAGQRNFSSPTDANGPAKLSLSLTFAKPVGSFEQFIAIAGVLQITYSGSGYQFAIGTILNAPPPAPTPAPQPAPTPAPPPKPAPHLPNTFPDRTFSLSTDGGIYYPFVNGNNLCLVTAGEGEGGGCGDDSYQSCQRACDTVSPVVQKCSWDYSSFKCSVITKDGNVQPLTQFLSTPIGIPYCNSPAIHWAGCTISEGYISMPALMPTQGILNTTSIRSWFYDAPGPDQSYNGQANVLITKDITRDKNGAILPINAPLSGCVISFTYGGYVVPAGVPYSHLRESGISKCGVSNRVLAADPFEAGARIDGDKDTPSKVGTPPIYSLLHSR